MPAIRTAKEIIYLEHMIPGIGTAKEKRSHWTNGENVGDLDVLIKDVVYNCYSYYTLLHFCFQDFQDFS